MSYDLGGSDLRAVQGINLILNVMKELKKLKRELEGVGMQWKSFGIFNQVSQIKLIVGTTGNRLANDFLVKKLNELNHELSWKFPHKGYIMRKTQESLDAARIALSKHFQSWERAKFDMLIKAMGSQTILDEPNAYPTKLLSYGKDEEEWMD